MLILNRKEGQSVVVTTEAGEEIELFILEVSGKYAKVGINAPPTVLVDRKEVNEARKEAKKNENK